MSKKMTILETNDGRIKYTSAWTNTGVSTEVQAEGASNTKYNVGYFGTAGKQLVNPDATPNPRGMLENEDFIYDQRLDDSSGDGVDIYDDNDSGAFDAGKYFRILENNINITDGTSGLGLKVIAKDLARSNISPAIDECFIDPVRGKFTMPAPHVWCKCESFENIRLPEIGLAYKPDFDISISGGRVTIAKFKFGNGIFAYNTSRHGGRHGTIKINPFNENIPNLNSGVTSFWSHVAGGARGKRNNTYYSGFNRFHLSPSTFIQHYRIGGFPGYNHYQLIIDGVVIQTVASPTFANIIVAWNTEGLDSGNTIEMWANGALTLSSTLPIEPENIYYWVRGQCHNGGSRSSIGYAQLDNYKIWLYDIKTVSDVVAMEYNGGDGREDAMHVIYGSGNQYKPVTKVGYYYKTTDEDPVELNEPTGAGNDEVELEDATNYSDGLGYFGEGMGKWVSGIAPNMDVQGFISETDFYYDEAIDGSGAHLIDIYDDADSGALDKPGGRHMRIVHAGDNITKSTGLGGLGLTPIAKDLSNIRITPNSDEVWIDPIRNTFVLPRPHYYSKCDNEEALTTEAICRDADATLEKLEWGGNTWNYIGKSSSNPYTPQTPKFGESLQFFTYSGGVANIFPFSKFETLDKGTISFWNWQYPALGYWFLNTTILFGDNSYVKLFNDWNDNISNQLFIGGSLEDEENVKTLQNNWHHLYILFDKDGGLDGGKTVRVFVDNTELLSSTTPFYASEIKITLEAQYAAGYNVSQSQLIDNIKVWREVLEAHNVSNPASWLYNAGTGREDALHTIYGSGNGFEPKLTSGDLGGVGYFILESAGEKAEWTIKENAEELYVFFRQETDAGIARLSLRNNTKGIDVIAEERISLYHPDFSSASNQFKPYGHRISIDSPEDEHILTIRHSGRHNVNSIGPNHPIRIDKFSYKEKLIDGDIETKLFMWHEDYPEDIYTFILEKSNMTSLYDITYFDGDGVTTTFTLPAHKHAYKFVEASINGGITWLPATDILLDWGSNNPLFDDEELDADRRFTVKFNLPPDVGIGNIQIKIIPYTNKYKLLRSISQPYDGGKYIDLSAEVRLLDDNIELIKEA